MLLRKYFGLKLCPACYHIQNLKNVGQLGECEVLGGLFPKKSF